MTNRSPSEPTGATGDVGFDLAPAAELLRAATSAVGRDDLDRPTPCDGWTVRELLEHVAAGPRFFAAVARHDLDGVEPIEIDADGRWQRALAVDLDEMVTAWRDPSAWAGETTVGDLTLPNERWAVIGFDEAVLHSWDLDVALGRPHVVPADRVLDVIEPFIEETASGPAVEGLWGSPVEVGPGSSRFERILALSGRDPAWRPG